MRFAYVKSGDVVAELQAAARSRHPISGGPETFTASFLQLIGSAPALLVSLASARPSAAEARVGDVRARVYHLRSGASKSWIALCVFFRLVIFRPTIVVCVRDGAILWASYCASRLLGATFLHSRQRALPSGEKSWRAWLSAAIDRKVIRNAARIICHGPFTHHQLQALGIPESRIIEFDVPLANLPAPSEPAPHGQRIFFVGRVEESKGVFDLLEACAPILKARADVELVFIGDGKALPVLRQRALAARLEARVQLMGRKPHSEVTALLSSATVLVTPTRHGLEGRCMSAVEGLAMGVPVVAPDAGAFPFLIESGVNGLLYEVDSVEDMRQKIEAVLDAPALRERLAYGALESERRRSATVKTFATALREAFGAA